MSPSDITLLERWQDRRDAKAFQELVSRHGGMVYAACSRILRNAADAEEVAQECFLALAQAKAHNIRLLGGWLHTFATHRSLDRVRADKRRQQRERRYAGAARAHVDATWNEIQHFVDEAIASLPEQLSCVVVGHFLEGRSQADLAQSLNLSPSAVSRRIDRAVELLRSSLHKRGLTVGLALLPGMLAEAASAAIPKSLVAALGKLALSGLRRVQPAATSTIAAGLLKPIAVKSGLAVLALAMIAALGFRFIGQPLSDVPDNRIVTSEPTSLAGSGPVQAASAQQSPSNFIAQPEIAQVSAQAQTNASVSGVVIYHDNGQPAEGMRVLLGTMNGQSNETLTDAQGAFAFNDLAPEEVVLLAYDARYDEVPEDWLRSEHVELSLVEGEAKVDIRIEVPPRGGQVGGRVVDKKTGVPLAGIVIDASRIGVGSYTAKTGRDGRYTIFGLREGEWLVRPDSNNPIFTSDFTYSIDRAVVHEGETTQLDFAVERSSSVSGRVVDLEGAPVTDAWVDAVLFMNERNMRMRCYVKTDPQGRFTFWARTGGERMTLSARRKDDMKSSSAFVKTIPGEAVIDVLLTLHAAVKVSGRFTDEDGRPIKASFWRRATHADGNAAWSGSIGEPAETFESMLARGNYEIKGQPEGNDFGVEELTQSIQVGSDALSNVTIKVRRESEFTGQYAIRGIVTDEKGRPLQRTRVYVRGRARENMMSFQETHTDSQGRFAFEGLISAYYQVHATPGAPFEQYAGFDSLNPADTPDITIVARLAAKLRGRVLDAQTGDPVRNFRADYGALDPIGRENRWERKSITSESGVFELRARLGQDWYVRIAADGYSEAIQTGAALASGEWVDDIHFRLSPSRVVQGVVTNAGDEPVARALVFHNENVFDVARRHEQYAAAVTDADGIFVLRSLPEDANFIYVAKSGYAVAQYPIGDRMSIVLTQGGVIEGRVLIGGAEPVEKISVVAMDIDSPYSRRWGRVDENGYYRIAELMDGTYRLQVNILDEAGRQTGAHVPEDFVETVDGMVTTYDISIPLGSATVTGDPEKSP